MRTRTRLSLLAAAALALAAAGPAWLMRGRPAPVETFERVDRSLVRSRAALERGEPQAAAIEARDALAEQPRNRDALELLSAAMARQGRPAGAVRAPQAP